MLRQDIKDFKNSSFITLIIILFVLLSIIAYALLRDKIVTNYEKDTKILFYKIQIQTSALLSNLMYRHSIEKDLLLKAHVKARKYLKEKKVNPLLVDLSEIYNAINDKNKFYNIYITDKDLVIRNSTFVKDIGFDLSFAQDVFDKHYEEKITGVSTPLFEIFSQEFFSYTDEYLVDALGKKQGVLQLSYTYKKSTKRLKEIQSTLEKYESIADVKAYIIINDKLTTEIILKNVLLLKPNLKDILKTTKDGFSLNNKLLHKKLIIHNFYQKGVSYTQMSIATQSPIFESKKLLYSILLDNSNLEAKLKTLNIFMSFVMFLGIIAIIITNRLRKKEIKLKEQDKFVQSSMHEIKTPLSIITLNNELRELEFGHNEYSLEIDSAIKTLKNSYEDMSFTITKDELSYPVETLILSDVLKERVAYFGTVATSKNKTIVLTTNSVCKVKIL